MYIRCTYGVYTCITVYIGVYMVMKVYKGCIKGIYYDRFTYLACVRPRDLGDPPRVLLLERHQARPAPLLIQARRLRVRPGRKQTAHVRVEGEARDEPTLARAGPP